MSKDQFDETLRRFLHRRPFIPFVMELLDGNQIEIDHPGVSFAEGSGCFLSSKDELIEFYCEKVREIHFASTETTP
jgi:hypothetical protein